MCDIVKFGFCFIIIWVWCCLGVILCWILWCFFWFVIFRFMFWIEGEFLVYIFIGSVGLDIMGVRLFFVVFEFLLMIWYVNVDLFVLFLGFFCVFWVGLVWIEDRKGWKVICWLFWFYSWWVFFGVFWWWWSIYNVVFLILGK